MNEPAVSFGHGAAARGLAARALCRVLSDGVTLDTALGDIARDSLAAGDQSQAKALNPVMIE